MSESEELLSEYRQQDGVEHHLSDYNNLCGATVSDLLDLYITLKKGDHLLMSNLKHRNFYHTLSIAIDDDADDCIHDVELIVIYALLFLYQFGYDRIEVCDYNLNEIDYDLRGSDRTFEFIRGVFEYGLNTDENIADVIKFICNDPGY